MWPSLKGKNGFIGHCSLQILALLVMQLRPSLIPTVSSLVPASARRSMVGVRTMLYFGFLLLFIDLVAQAFASQMLYVVYMGSHSGDLEPDTIDTIHLELLTNVVGSKEIAHECLVYSYKHFINGFSAFLKPHHVSAISEMPGVISVFRNRAHQLHTTRSWEFLGLEHPSTGATPKQSLWEKANYGTDVIIGVLDSGVWPESESFNDRGLGSIPARWKGTCESGSNFTSANCNRKLIGARYFVKGYEATNGPLNVTSTGEFLSPRDKAGHGSHTSSTAGGSFVPNANIFGFGNGTAKGGAPFSRLAVYKVCWTEAELCYDADILAAFDAGIQDGVDVFSVSLGSSPPLVNYFADGIAVGSFHAVSRGKLVVCSAGNSGPVIATVSNVAPWIFTVAASSIDRDFLAAAVLGDRSHFPGASLSEYKLEKKLYPLVFSGDVQLATANASAGQLCFPGSLDPERVKGKIVACMRGVNPRVQKGAVVKEAGGVGLILLNQPANADEVISEPHVLPATHVNAGDADSILSYINEARSSASAFINYPTTLLKAKPAPQMASFSSQGPNSLTPDILKPDITAPGLNILAAWTEASAPTEEVSDHRIVRYNVISGTSMSCPHVTGIVALLRAVHPTWSAAAIKSALMTSATHHDNAMQAIQNGSLDKATPFNYGAGHVNPNAAANPGLVYDASTQDYFLFLCNLHNNRSSLRNLIGNNMTCPEQPSSVVDLNYPSITLSRLSGNRTVLRTVTYVGGNNTYEVVVRPPEGIQVEVLPSKLTFNILGETKSFSVIFRVKKGASKGKWVFGSLTWTDKTYLVTIPIVLNAT